MKNKLEKNKNHGKAFLRTIKMAYKSSAIKNCHQLSPTLDFSLLFIILKLNTVALNPFMTEAVIL